MYFATISAKSVPRHSDADIAAVAKMDRRVLNATMYVVIVICWHLIWFSMEESMVKPHAGTTRQFDVP